MKELFNPNPSSLRTARMLNYRTPKVANSFSGIKTPQPLHLSRPFRAQGGSIPDSPDQPFTGPIVTSSLGRADTDPMHVPSGAYVLPADVVSHMGQGNSIAGLKIAHLMFNPQPYGAQGGPFGSPMGKPVKGKGMPIPKARPVQPLKAHAGAAPTPSGPAPQAHGGDVPGHGPATPIAASGGEFVISPAEVKRRGGGDISHGHAILDAFVKGVRQDHIATLQKLPGPAQD